MWLIWWDPCGLLCVAIGQLVVWFADYVTIRYVIDGFFKWSPAGIVHAIIFQTIIFLIVVSHFRAMCTDPGTVEMHTATEADRFPPADDPDRDRKPKRRYCRRCECIKPPRAHHCSTCDRCIYKMDHHCPWVGNCVAANNFKYFLQFLFYVFVGCVYAALLMTYRVAYCMMAKNRRMAPPECRFPPTYELVMCIVSTVCAIFFAIFVVAMGCDQYEGMTTDTTGIESMKQWDEEDRSLCEGMADYCGEPFGVNWLVPKPMPVKSQYKWSKDDDPDAFDPRDPLVQRFFYNLQRKEELDRITAEDEASGRKILRPPRPHIPNNDGDIISDDDDDGDGGVDVQCHPTTSIRGAATAAAAAPATGSKAGSKAGSSPAANDAPVPAANNVNDRGAGARKSKGARKRNVARS